MRYNVIKLHREYRAVVYFGCDKILCQTNIPYIDILSTSFLENYLNGTLPQYDLFRHSLLQIAYRLTKITASFLPDIDEAPTKLMLFHEENTTFFMRFRLSTTLKRLKTLMKTETFENALF